MSDFAWRVEGIEKARAAGGVDLEMRRRPGFTGRMELRAVQNWPSDGSGISTGRAFVTHDPMPDWLPPSRAKR